ncbi:MAG TPA: hypothetical protein VEP93_01720 [Variovorax sp.]|nr:hypothetical protein [Variovorax sp.]
MNTPSDRALLERALVAIEQVMGKRDAALDWGVPVGTPAHEATSLCLTAASALVDVAQTLLRQPSETSLEVLSAEWQAVIAHTKNAGRTAHKAVLLLSTQQNLVAAQAGVIVSGSGGH